MQQNPPPRVSFYLESDLSNASKEISSGMHRGLELEQEKEIGKQLITDSSIQGVASIRTQYQNCTGMDSRRPDPLECHDTRNMSIFRPLVSTI
jgi:hypothetical protein